MQTAPTQPYTPGEVGLLPGWSWRATIDGWWLGMASLLLLLGGGLAVWAWPDESALPRLSRTVIPFLAVATLLAVTADSLATLLVVWMVLDLLWLLLLVSARAPVAAQASFSPRFLLPILSLFFLWLAALSLPAATGSVGLAVRGWPVVTRALLLLAALLQIGVFPLHFWRPLAGDYPALVSLFAHTAPAIAGAALFVRLETGAATTLGFALPLTLAALLGLLWSANAAWQANNRPRRVAAVVAVGQASLLLLAGTWAGAEAAAAEARVLFLAGGILLLATARPENAFLERLGPAVALTALAGLPLTAGFTGRAAVYEAWLGSGRWLLVVVTALLHVPFLAAALLLVWQKTAEASTPADSRADMATLVALLLPALGLVSLAGLTIASPLSWLAILLPPALAYLLVHFLEETDAARQVVHDALSLPLDLGPFFALTGQGARTAGRALREALVLLEGERGLLWLALILLLIWFVG